MATKKRLIDAKEGKKVFVALARPAEYKGVIHMVVPISEIDRLPTVNAVEVVHGHWEEDHWEYVCSCCQKHFTDELPWISHPEYGMPNYCPNCGAKMRGERNA